MKSGSGSPTTKPRESTSLFTQTRWRKWGGLAIGLAALMAWVGVHSPFVRASLAVFVVYWALFGALFVVALIIVILDLRYIRLQYVVGKREIFQQTLGEESFRKSLKTRPGRAAADEHRDERQ